MDEVDYEPQDGHHSDDGATDHDDPSNVPDDVAVLLGRAGRQQTLTAGSAWPSGFAGSDAFPCSGPAVVRGSLLGDDLGLELGGSSFLCRGECSSRTLCGA